MKASGGGGTSKPGGNAGGSSRGSGGSSGGRRFRQGRQWQWWGRRFGRVCPAHAGTPGTVPRLLALGGNPDEVIFTNAATLARDSERAWTAVLKKVCVRCQADYPNREGNFVPGIQGDPGGPWGD